MRKLTVPGTCVDVEFLVMGIIQNNVYVISDGKGTFVVDPTADAPAIVEALDGRALDAIVLTHHHADHMGAAAALREMTGATVIASAVEAPLIRNPKKVGDSLFPAPESCEVDYEVSDGEIVKIYNRGEDDVPPVLAGAGLTRTMAPRNEQTVEKFPIEKVKSDWAEYYRNVIATLNGKAEIVVTHDQLRRSMKLIEAVFESARKNEVVKF